MNWKKFFNLPVATVFMALTLSGCFEEVVPLQVGSMIPPTTLTLLDGELLEISDPLGKGKVITFMSSWCPCSNNSIPMMKKAYDEHGKGAESKITFLMIGIQDPESKFRKFVEKWDIPFLVGYDDGDDIAQAFGILQPPTTIFVDKKGVVERIFYGDIKEKEKEFYQWTRGLL